MARKTEAVSSDRSEDSILIIRGHKVILDSDLAVLYGVSVGRLNEAVKHNRDRFPVDFNVSAHVRGVCFFKITSCELELEIANCDIKFGLGRPAPPAVRLYRA